MEQLLSAAKEYAHRKVFENENDAHKWVRENEGEGQFSVVDAATGEKIDDSRGETF